jgi:uncharacterized protein (TIGR02099 family)
VSSSSNARLTPQASSQAAAARPRWRRPLKWLLITVAMVIVLVASLLGAFGIVVGRVPEYRVQVQDWLSDRTGLVVEFRSLSARLRLFGPELVFDDAVVRTPDRQQVLAAAKRGSVGFDIWNSLRNGQLSAGRFSLRSPQISLIRTREGRIQLLGQGTLPERPQSEPVAIGQLPTGRFKVTDAIVNFRDEFTGRGPWSMSGVSFTLVRSTDSIQLAGKASLPATLGSELQFSANAKGGLQNPRDVISTFTVSGKGLDLSGWADVFPDEWPAPETGSGSMQISGSLRGPQLTQLTANIDFRKISTELPTWSVTLPAAAPLEQKVDEELEDTAPQNTDTSTQAPAVPEPPIAVPVAPTTQMVSYERVAFLLEANRVEDEWKIALSDLDVSRVDAPWQAAQINATLSAVPGSSKVSVDADRIVLENLWPLLAYFPESESLARLRALRASGTLENLSAQMNHAAVGEPLQYSVQAAFEDVSFEPIERIPGLSGLTGKVQANHESGELRIESENMGFELPRMFRQALAARVLTGTVDWKVLDDGVSVHSDELRAETEDGKGTASVQVFVPRDGSSPVLDLAARGEELNVAATRKYVPAHKITPKTLAWFDRAFVGGIVRSATFNVKGPTRTFPFRKGEGTFTATAQVENATLAYHEEWLPASGINAELEFRNQGMSVRASSAQVGGLTTKSARADIVDFKENELRIAATTSGDLTAAFEFIHSSPLREALGEQFERIAAKGAMAADVKLFFPIRNMEERDINVTARVTDATVTHRDIDAPVRALQGSLKIHNSQIAAADLSGRWLSGPFDVTVTAQDGISSTLNAQGRAAAERLKPLLGLPAGIDISGATDWQLTTTLFSGRASDVNQPEIHLLADLRDFGLALPAPVGKREGEAGTLELDVSFEERDRMLMRGSLNDVRALVGLRRAGGTWQLDRGGVRADGVAASLPAHRGLRIEGTIERFVLDDWLALKGSGPGKPLSEYLRAANVRVGSFELFGYRWTDLRGILQATPSGWRVDVDGPQAAGQVLIPEPLTGNAPLRAALEHLVLAKADGVERIEKDTPADPRNIPGLDIHVTDLQMGERSIGAVDLKAARVPAGLQFEQMQVSGSSVSAQGRGEWLVTPEGVRSSLNATVTSTDVAATLSSLSYTPFLEAKHGEIRADLNWPGGFDDHILEQSSGRISITAEGGQIVNLQPGAGRVLGLFSVAALPRRLALDFSDLTEKGLAFDTIHGDFDLREGNAYTDNLLLRGPAAEIGIAGRTGFGSRDYDQTAVVTGNLGASIPVAGALAGGPAVGAALLLFSQVFKEPLKGMTRGYYRITGPWDNPNVERVDATDAKDASARAVPP